MAYPQLRIIFFCTLLNILEVGVMATLYVELEEIKSGTLKCRLHYTMLPTLA